MLASDLSVQMALADVQVAIGRAPADLLLTDCRLLNVWSAETYTTNIAIRRGRIVAIRTGFEPAADQVVACGGRFALPGFIAPLAAGAIADPALLLSGGVTSVVLPVGAAAPDAGHLRLWNQVAGRTGWDQTSGRASPLQAERSCDTIEEIEDEIAQGSAILIDATPERAGLLQAMGQRGTDTARIILRQGAGGAGSAFGAALRAGFSPVVAAQICGFNAAVHYGIEHEVGSIAPGRLADILLFDALDDLMPQMVICDGKVISEAAN